MRRVLLSLSSALVNKRDWSRWRTDKSYLNVAMSWKGKSSSIGFECSNGVTIHGLGDFHSIGGREGALILQIRSQPSTEAAKIHSVRNKDSQEIFPAGR